jgi:hypothetical protein
MSRANKINGANDLDDVHRVGIEPGADGIGDGGEAGAPYYVNKLPRVRRFVGRAGCGRRPSHLPAKLRE